MRRLCQDICIRTLSKTAKTWTPPKFMPRKWARSVRSTVFVGAVTVDHKGFSSSSSDSYCYRPRNLEATWAARGKYGCQDIQDISSNWFDRGATHQLARGEAYLSFLRRWRWQIMTKHSPPATTTPKEIDRQTYMRTRLSSASQPHSSAEHYDTAESKTAPEFAN